MRRFFRFALVLASALTFGESVAQAYIPPADFLLRMVAERRRRMGLRDMTVQLQTEVVGGDSQIEERVYMKNPERMRWQRETNPETVYVEKEGVRAQGTPKLVRLSGPPTDLLALLFFPKGDDLDQIGPHMMAGLRAAGIDVQTVTMTRNGEDIAYVIGAQPWETDKPQVWIDKERFLPVRFVFRVPGSSQPRLEIRLSEYGSAVAGDYFPRVVETYKDHTLERRAEVVSAHVNEGLAESLFDIP